MKIKLPAILSTHVGYKTRYGTQRAYFADDRPNLFPTAKTAPIIERRVGLATVFDYDFKATTRAKALAGAALIVVLAPTLILACAVIALTADLWRSVKDIAANAWEVAAYAAEGVADLLGQVVRP